MSQPELEVERLRRRHEDYVTETVRFCLVTDSLLPMLVHQIGCPVRPIESQKEEPTCTCGLSDKLERYRTLRKEVFRV